MKSFIFFCLVCFVFASEHQRVAMKDIDVVRFANGQMTEGRRLAPVPQMQCVGGACHRANDVMRTAICKNIGSDGKGVIWKCEAALPEGYDLGATTVSCEGWEKGGDPYVLAGSCQLKYELKETPTTKQKIPHVTVKQMEDAMNKAQEKRFSSLNDPEAWKRIEIEQSKNHAGFVIGMVAIIVGVGLLIVVVGSCIASADATRGPPQQNPPRETRRTTTTNTGGGSTHTHTHTESTRVIHEPAPRRSDPVSDAIAFNMITGGGWGGSRRREVHHVHHNPPPPRQRTPPRRRSPSPVYHEPSAPAETHTSTSYADSESR